MIRQRIEAYIRGVDKAFPNLYKINPYERTGKIAYACYLEDKTIGRKSTTDTSPISFDTIGIASLPVIGQFGDKIHVPFLAVDLIDGGSGEPHYNEIGLVTNQTFIIPPVTDLTNVVPIDNVNPSPAPIIDQTTAYKRLIEINDFYASPDGLKRPGGMVIDNANPVRADVESLGQWQYQIAVLGVSVENIKSQIRHSEEWKAKHPGEVPF